MNLKEKKYWIVAFGEERAYIINGEENKVFEAEETFEINYGELRPEYESQKKKAAEDYVKRRKEQESLENETKSKLETKCTGNTDLEKRLDTVAPLKNFLESVTIVHKNREFTYYPKKIKNFTVFEYENTLSQEGYLVGPSWGFNTLESALNDLYKRWERMHSDVNWLQKQFRKYFGKVPL